MNQLLTINRTIHTSTHESAAERNKYVTIRNEVK